MSDGIIAVADGANVGIVGIKFIGVIGELLNTDRE
jgi:hypothetical protein